MPTCEFPLSHFRECKQPCSPDNAQLPTMKRAHMHVHTQASIPGTYTMKTLCSNHVRTTVITFYIWMSTCHPFIFFYVEILNGTTLHLDWVKVAYGIKQERNKRKFTITVIELGKIFGTLLVPCFSITLQEFYLISYYCSMEMILQCRTNAIRQQWVPW